MVGIRWNAWNTIPTVPRRNRASASSPIRVSSCPATCTVPEVAASNPASTISKLVFPDPEGPTIPTASPASTRRSTPDRMLTGPAAEGTVSRRPRTSTRRSARSI